MGVGIDHVVSARKWGPIFTYLVAVSEKFADACNIMTHSSVGNVLFESEFIHTNSLL